MYEHVEVSTRACTGFVQNARTSFLEANHRLLKIRYTQSDVVNARTSLGDELRNGRTVIGGLQKLDARTPYRQHRSIYMFLSNDFPERNRKSQLRFIKGKVLI